MNNITKKIIEFFAFTYFNWIVVVPLLIPWMLFIVGVEPEEFWIWFYTSLGVSLYVGWITVKADSKFAPWFYKKMRMNKKTQEELIVERIDRFFNQDNVMTKSEYKSIETMIRG